MVPFRWSAVTASTSILLQAQFTVAQEGWYSQIQPCPHTCSASGTSSANWTAYHDTWKLLTCEQPMLPDFNIHNPVDSPSSSLSLFACYGSATAGDATWSGPLEATNATHIEKAEVETVWSGRGNKSSATYAVDVVQHASAHWEQGVCDSTEPRTAFAYFKGAYVGIYSGGMLHKQAATNLV